MLELKNIHKFYNHGTINEMCLFENFNLTIDDGQFVSVVGSNGSGKTSMLNLICGSIPLDSGSIIIDGKDIAKEKEFKRNQYIGRVFQNTAMGTCPSMTIAENIWFFVVNSSAVAAYSCTFASICSPEIIRIKSSLTSSIFPLI